MNREFLKLVLDKSTLLFLKIILYYSAMFFYFIISSSLSIQSKSIKEPILLFFDLFLIYLQNILIQKQWVNLNSLSIFKDTLNLIFYFVKINYKPGVWKTKPYYFYFFVVFIKSIKFLSI